jgi:hypothetical protein
MSDMETGRKAGGSGWPFTAAVVIAIVALLLVFAWRIYGEGSV